MLASPFESVPGPRCFRHLHPRAAEDSEVTPEDSEDPEDSEVTSPGRAAGEHHDIATRVAVKLTGNILVKFDQPG